MKTYSTLNPRSIRVVTEQLEDELRELTKAELVDMINKLPGEKVSSRPKKAVLIEILQERMDSTTQPSVTLPLSAPLEEECCPVEEEAKGFTLRYASYSSVVFVLSFIIAILILGN